MTRKEFSTTCKSNGINIKTVSTKKRKTVISYNYDLPNSTASEVYTRTYYNNSIQDIFDFDFAHMFGFIRF